MKLKLLFLSLLIVSIGYAQKKEKIKGNKLVKVTQSNIEAFSKISLEEDIEVFILKGNTPMIEIEADENLHDVIETTVTSNTLHVKTNKNITSKKKLNIRITYTQGLNAIELKEKAVLNSLIDLELENLSVITRDQSKLFLTAKVAHFDLTTYNKSKTELNLTGGTNYKIIMSESSTAKALIYANTVQFDLYQKANATIEGETDSLKLRTDNATNFKGSKLTATNCSLIAEGSSDCEIEVKKQLVLEASGSSEVYIYNTPKIDLNKFADSARLYKK